MKLIVYECNLVIDCALIMLYSDVSLLLNIILPPFKTLTKR